MAEMKVTEKPPVAAKRATRPAELAGPRAPAKPLSLFAALRAMTENPLATIPVVAYEQPIWAARSMFGNQLVVSDPAGIHRHRTLWNDPERFDPDRFSRERSTTRPRFAYLPFGGGPRICIGAQLALTEVSLLLASHGAALSAETRPRTEHRSLASCHTASP